MGEGGSSAAAPSFAAACSWGRGRARKENMSNFSPRSADSRDLIGVRIRPADSRDLFGVRIRPADSRDLFGVRIRPADSRDLFGVRIRPSLGLKC